jgi:hypothetical protein
MIPVSYDGNNINDGTNYESLFELDGYGLPLIDVVTAKRQGSWPLMSGIKRNEKRISLQVFIRGASVDTLRKQLYQYFDYEDETPKQFIVEDFGGGNDRYVMAVSRGVFPDEIMPQTCYHVALVIDGDVRWRETTPTATSAWSITATGQTKVVSNSGEDDAYPILKIKPTSNKTGDYLYKRFMVVKWLAGTTLNYPVDIANNGLDTQIASTNFALASGDDLRVWVNGVEVDRWLDGPNTATTKVFVNLDFQADIPMTLDGAINNSVTEITVNESIGNMPSTGIFRIDTENITYTGKNSSSKTFTGCSRGAKGTTAASHTDGTDVFWLQHDIWIVYGNASAGSPPADAEKSPAFNLANSSNTSWDYDNFGRDADQQSGAWNFQRLTGALMDLYTANHWTSANPWSEIGIIGSLNSESAQWVIENPCYITNANFQNGEYYVPDTTNFTGELRSYKPSTGQWNDEYSLTFSVATTWTAWSQNEAIISLSSKVAMYFEHEIGGFGASGLECSDVTLTLNSTYTPVIVIGAEQGNYTLECVITNNTTGDSIELLFSMQLNDQLELDTDNKTVIYLDDDSNQFKALTITGGPRRDWLPLQSGNNTLQFDDVGTNGVTIDISFDERFYQ